MTDEAASLARVIELLPLREGVGGCEHSHMTWGFDPGVVTCSCGARWRAVLMPGEKGGTQ